jgi:hypothetical protein
MIRKEMTIQRLTLIGMALGLFMIVQPWSPLLFDAGFPFTLISIIAYNVSGWRSGERAEKFRDDGKKRAEAGR